MVKISKDASGSSFLIGDDQYPINFFRASYGKDSKGIWFVELIPLIVDPSLAIRKFSISIIEDGAGATFDTIDELKAFIGTTIFGLTGGGGGSTDVAWADIQGVPAELTAAQAAGTPSIRAIGTLATNAAAGNHVHGVASGAGNGFMSSGDKTKLDGIATAANNYTNAQAVSAVAAKTTIVALTAIATPATATTEEIATKVNAVIAALK